MFKVQVKQDLSRVLAVNLEEPDLKLTLPPGQAIGLAPAQYRTRDLVPAMIMDQVQVMSLVQVQAANWDQVQGIGAGLVVLTQ